MSGGGGFRGRGFATRGHRRQGVEGSGGQNARNNRHDSRGGNARSQGSSGARSGFHGRGSRSNAQSDGANSGMFRGNGIGRQNFNSSRGRPLHQAQIPESNWSNNNWSGNNWSDNNMSNNWSDNNMGNNWSSNDLGNNWMDNNSGNNWSDNVPGNNWSDNNPGNNWSDNNLGNNWSNNNSSNNWSSRGGGPSPGGFSAWSPTRFNRPPVPPFYRSQGQNSFVPYSFPPPVGTNYLPPPIVDYPPVVEAEPQNTQKSSTNLPKAPHQKKPTTKPPKPQKQIAHPGSEEERLQKITEAADKLKRTLSTIKSAPDTWYNDDVDGALEFNQQDQDHEPRMANRGIPELKHDPPELNLTLNDLRDIGRVDHDHTTRAHKSSNDADQNIDESEVEILEHRPVQRVPEATIDIDLWPEDNPDDSTQNRWVETNENTEVSNDISESSQSFVDTTSATVNDETISNSEKFDSRLRDETMSQDFNERETVEEVTKDSAQVDRENTVEVNTQNVNLDGENVVRSPSSQAEEKRIVDEHFNENNENSQMEETATSSIEDGKTETENIACNQTKETELSKTVENVQIDGHFENCDDSKVTTELVVTCESRKTSNEQKIDPESQIIKEVGEIGVILDERIETRENDSTKELKDDKNDWLSRQKEAEIRAEPEKAVDEKIEDGPAKTTVESDNVASNDLPQNKNKISESCVNVAQAAIELTKDARTDKQNDGGSPCDATNNDDLAIKETKNSDVTTDQSENEPKEKVVSTVTDHSSSKDNDEPKIGTSIDKKIDSEVEKKVEEKSGKAQDNTIVKNRQEERTNSKPETKKQEESSRVHQEIDEKSRERKKLVRTTGFDNISSRNRRSTTDSTVRNPSGHSNPNDRQSPTDRGASPNATHHRINRNESPLSNNIEKPNYGNSSSAKRSKEDNSGGLIKLNRKQRAQNVVGIEEPVQTILPPAFDPRLSSRERSVLMSSSMSINQDFSMAPGFPPITMTSLVPSGATINYGVPVGVPPPTTMTTSITPASNISSICMADPFVPILPNVPIVSPMVLPNELMLQPPLPVQLPPPLPPPEKATINMEAELVDMQEAMEFAKQLMNMNDSIDSSENDILDPDISDESGFFHMPTFPDLPPIELPPMPPVENKEMKNKETKTIEQPISKECSVKKTSHKNVKQETTTYGPAPMPLEYQKSPSSQKENIEESSGLDEEQLRPKVVFNLNARPKIMNKHDEWHHQNHRDDESGAVHPFVSTTSKATVVEPSQNRKNQANPGSPVIVTAKERSRATNGHEDRRKHDEKSGSTRYNGKIDSSSHSRSDKNLEELKSRSPTPPKHVTHLKSSKRDEDNSRNDQTNKTVMVKRSSKETASKKSSNDPQTPESSWKSRVIGRFLKMSKNDIGNMLNNASLRKFDIAMKHLVKERRSSLSLEMRNNEEERMRDSEVTYNREEFMDQLSAMLDPSATVDVCNLPTQFIHHLSEVLHLDTMSEFDSSQMMSEGLGYVSSPATQSSPKLEPRKQVSREIVSSREKDVASEQCNEKKRRREKQMEGAEAAATSATTPASVLEKSKVLRGSEKAVAELPRAENTRTENVEYRTLPGPRSKRRRVRATVADQQSKTINNGTSLDNDSNSLNMADLDDIFSAGIARAKKKPHDLPVTRTAKKTEESLNTEENIVPVAKDPNVDRVERAVVELDEIFTAGIARAKLASKKVAETAKPVEVVDEADEERGWNPGNLRINVDSHRLRQSSSSSGRKTSKIEKWSRHVHCEEPVAFRNLTKEEWEAKYSEPSYSAYQREYRAMEALREERSRRSPLSEGRPDYNAFDINDLGSIKSRLGEPVSGNVDHHEDWSGSELSRGRNVNEATNYTVDYNRSSGDNSSSSTSSSSSSSSDNEDNEATPSVTKLLKVIKEREKIAKQKSFNEEIRDEVTAEIERKKRERDKLKKRRRPRPKKSSHHRRRKDRRGKVRERKKRERKRKKRRSRHSDGNSKEGSVNEGADEMSSGSRGREPQRLLNEDEIKKEIVVKAEPDVEVAVSNEKTSVKCCGNVKPVEDPRPASTTLSVPSIVPPPSANQTIAHQTKTKAQLKQMPGDIKINRVATVTNVNEEPAKNQHVQVDENIPLNILPVASETSNVSKQSDNCSVPTAPTVITPELPIQPVSVPSDNTSSLKTNSKKLDIKTYKERARQRQLKQTEKIRLLSENPTSLTQNLLNIPLSRKKEVETVETNAVEPLKDPRLRKLEGTSTSMAMSSDEKVSSLQTTSNVVCDPNSANKTSIPSNSHETNVSSVQVARKKITRPNFTTAQTNNEPQTVAKVLPADAGKFAHIKSEGKKELQLREKLKRGRSRTSIDTPETTPPPVVPPTRLNRRRSLVTAGTVAPATELKTNHVPLSSNLDPTRACDNSESSETSKNLNETPNVDDEKNFSVSDSSNIIENLDCTKNVTAAKTPELSTNFNEIRGLDIPKTSHETKTSNEPKISNDIDTLNDTVISSSSRSKIHDPTKISETSTNLEPTESLNIFTNVENTEILDNSKLQAAPELLENPVKMDCSNLKNTLNPSVSIQPNNSETSNLEKDLNISEILDTPKTLDNLRDSNEKELSEKLKSPKMPETVKKTENSETPQIPDTLEAVLKNPENSDVSTSLETSTIIPDVSTTSVEPKLLNTLEKVALAEESTESEVRDGLQVQKEIEKNETILNGSELIPLEIPMEELPDWSLEAAAITSNIPESLDYSNDSVPFKGFTEETILRRDRVLTEAEITEDSELNTFESLPLNFVSEGVTNAAENIDLDEITNTDVADSLDSLPLTYSEQFQNTQDDIETSLPDPLGHTIYTVASEIVDIPVTMSMSLEPLHSFANEDANEKESEPQEQSIEVATKKSDVLENLSNVDNFIIDDVNTRDTVPSPILDVEAESAEPSLAELTKSTSEMVEQENTTLSRNKAVEEVTVSKELLDNEMKVATAIEPCSTDTETLPTVANAPSEKKQFVETESSVSASNDDHFVEDSAARDVDTGEKLEKQITEVESSSKMNDTKEESIDKNVTETNEEAAPNEEAENSSTTHPEKHDSESKSKDSSHHSREHSHGKVKKNKSSRNHNHGSRTSKKTTLTEKLVDEAITANVVKLVAKPNSRLTVMARMMEIDVEIHKLMNEKMTLYKMLESGDFTSCDNEESTGKPIDESKVTSEKEKDVEVGRTNVPATAISKTTEETTKKTETKSSHVESDDKTKKRKRSPHREGKHRSRERDVAEPRRERKPSESKSHTSRSTLSEETPSRNEMGVNNLREKSTSLTDLEDSEERRRKKEKSPSRQSSKRHNVNSSKEDLLEVSRDGHKADKSTKSDSAKREKSKKTMKPSIESKKSEAGLKKSKSREGKSSSEKILVSNTENIYSDESNLELQEPNDSRKNHETSAKKEHIGSSTGLGLLEKSLKREMAHHRKAKSMEKRKKKRQELRRSLLDATVMTASEAKTGLMNLFERKKLHRKDNATSSGTKDKTRSRHPGKVSKHVSSIIEAVATNRVEDLYTENSRGTPVDDGTSRNTEEQENRAVGENENEERIEKEGKEEEQEENVQKAPEGATNKIKKHQNPEEVEKTIKDSEDFSSRKDADSVQKDSHDEKEDSNPEEYHNRKDSPVPSESEIPDIPKTPDIVEDNLVNSDSEMLQKEDILDTRLPSKEDNSVKNSRTELRMEEEEEQEKRGEVGTRSQPATPECPEPSGLDGQEKTNRGNEGQSENSDERWIDEAQGEEKRGVKIVEEAIEMNDTFVEDDEEIIPRSRSRMNSRRTKQRGKSRSRTRRERKSQHKDTRHSPPSQEYASDDNDQEDVSLRRPRSASSRNNKNREKATPPSRRGSRQSEDNAKSTRGRKREHERSNSRGLSPYDGEPLRKRSHSHRSVTPTIQSSMSDHQSKKKGRKRKRREEMSVEEMMRCKVELIDCKYTYLSPTMHPKILKKLGISRINRYVAPSKIIENLSPPVLTRNETPSPPTLNKAFEEEDSTKELDDIVERNEIPEFLENSVTTKKTVEEEEKMEDDKEEIEGERIQSPIECLVVKENVDDEDDEDEDDEDDDNIQIVKVLDDNLPITPQGIEDDDVRSVKDMEQDECIQIDTNANRPEVISVEEDYDTNEEYEVIDEVTDENEDEVEETNDEVQVVQVAAAPTVTLNPTEPEGLSHPENNDNENESRRTRYTVHKGPILDIKVLEDSFLAASEDGAIYRYSQTSNGILNIYKGHEAAVTCIYVLEMPGKRWNLYSGSLDGTFRCYDITTGAQDRSANVASPVQCMDQGWGIIYIGTKSGHISRYSIKSGGLKGDRLEFSDKSVLALKASAEGPRRVLIVASRNQPITIRDANTGLFLRTICGYKNHTVYSLMRDRNLVYCGTSSTSIPVYDFTNGEQITQYNAGVGIVCMRLYRQILFAGCYDGNIYVFDTLESKLLCSIPGPGNMLLSMEVVNDEIIAGSKNRQLHSWRMPKKVRALLAERT